MRSQAEIDLCKNCKHRKMDLKDGLLCGLTNRKPDFKDTCPDYAQDEVAVSRNKDKYKGAKGGINPSPRMYISILVMFLALGRCGYKVYKYYNPPVKKSILDDAYFNRIMNQQNVQHKLNKSRVLALGAKPIDTSTIAIADNMHLEFPEGFYYFPNAQTETVPFIAYAMHYVVSYEKLPVSSDLGDKDLWDFYQRRSANSLPFLPYYPISHETVMEGKIVEGATDLEFSYQTIYGMRYGVTRLLMKDKYLYAFTITGNEEKYSSLRKYLGYYVKIDSEQ